MHYSRNDPLVLDVESRRAQAAKILSVIDHFARRQGMVTQQMRCVDIGCSAGIITHALTQTFGQVVGIDVDWSALHTSPHPLSDPETGRRSGSWGAVNFIAASGLALPFADESFDAAVCNQVYQYVPDVPRLLDEIYRVLRRGAFCYFSARNLWGVAAKENRLPLIASVSPRAAQIMAHHVEPERNWRQRAGTLCSYRTLRTLAERRFSVHDYTLCALSDPALSNLFVPSRYRGWFQRAPRMMLQAVRPILPTHIWVLQKP